MAASLACCFILVEPMNAAKPTLFVTWANQWRPSLAGSPDCRRAKVGGLEQGALFILEHGPILSFKQLYQHCVDTDSKGRLCSKNAVIMVVSL